MITLYANPNHDIESVVTTAIDKANNHKQSIRLKYKDSLVNVFETSSINEIVQQLTLSYMGV